MGGRSHRGRHFYPNVNVVLKYGLRDSGVLQSDAKGSFRSATGGRSASASRNCDRSVLTFTQLDTAERTWAGVETALRAGDATAPTIDATCASCLAVGTTGAAGLPLRAPRALARLCIGARCARLERGGSGAPPRVTGPR